MKLPIFKTTQHAVQYGYDNRDREIAFRVMARKARIDILARKIAKSGRLINRESWLVTQSQLCRECLQAITGVITPEKLKAIYQ